jgi:5-methylcytosine-specific restriction endonuclease McrA
MIDEEATFQRFGYRSTDFKSKPIIAICDNCGKAREVSEYSPLCHSCANKKNGEAKRGRKQSKEVIEARMKGYYASNKKAGRKKGSIPHNLIPRETRTCACGCGGTFICKINSKKRYISCHYTNSPEGIAASRERARKSREKRSGSNSLLWKGTTPLTESIRCLLENKNWREACLKRDDYTCQDCKTEGRGKRGVYLEVDHTRPLAVLVQEFLQYYSEFSPIKDIEKLLKLAQTWTPFWDLNNGRTLCKKHHNERRTETVRLIKALKR